MHIKGNKGLVGSDVTIAIIILMIFVTISTTIFYQISMSNISIERYAVANNLLINVVEYIKLMQYKEYTNADFSGNNDNDWCRGKGINIPDKYKVNITKYSDIEKDNIMQEFEVIVKYSIRNEEKEIKIRTLKVNESAS